ncbi:MAG: YggS family pyridoxal phosphate-dependent enzyme [Negativicutes bacterium]|nr:YggS family pyridoxal phosphate-dependent enzyme [Negativicutes bacterium]
MSSIQENVIQIQAEIEAACRRANRAANAVTLIAVSKTVGPEAVQQAIEAGLNHFGENKAQEFVVKAAAFPDAHWHFIGHLQTNKVRGIVHQAELIHSLDRLDLAAEIQKRAGGAPVHCLLEVNVAAESSKFGLKLDEVTTFCHSLSRFPAIMVDGLMTIAPAAGTPEEIRSVFRCLRQKREELQALRLAQIPCFWLSMGMTNDYPIAIEEGADFVRIGTGIFGKRSSQ